MDQEEEERVYEAYVLITSVVELSDGWIRFSLKSTDPKGTMLEKYYQTKEGEVFKSGSTIWKVLLYRDSEMIKSIQISKGYCLLF